MAAALSLYKIMHSHVCYFHSQEFCELYLSYLGGVFIIKKSDCTPQLLEGIEIRRSLNSHLFNFFISYFLRLVL